MAYDTTKLTKLEALKALAERVKQETDANKASITTLSGRVDSIEAAGGEPNVLEGVKVNGTALAIAEKMVDILIATGSTNGTIKVNGVEVSVAGLAAMAYKANVSQSDLDTAFAAVIAAKADSATTIDGYGITDAYTKEQVDAKISSVYKPAGSVTFANLPTPAEAVLGNVYNVTDSFTTTDSFVEGAGSEYPAGTNVVVVSTGTNTYGYDVLAGFVDLTRYVEKETGKGLSANDYTDTEKAKLAGVAEGATKVEASATNGSIVVNGSEMQVYNDDDVLKDSDVATDNEVTEMLTDVFGSAE